VAFTNEHTELRRLMLLAVVALATELLLMPGAVFKLQLASAEWPASMQLVVILLPRFVVMLALVLIFGPFRNGHWFSGLLAAYGALVVTTFYRTEAFVAWSSAMAASRATLPYVAGVFGAGLAFWIVSRTTR
jgi:hypothetical protein